jgi:pyruvate dehydrogenase E2 component (dihydrolipoamide acetyltransferase)
MITKVVMPRLSLTMKEGSVVQWFKKEGETVNKGEPLVEVLSEKATIEVEAPASGILRKVLAERGVDVPVNATLGIIAAANDEIPEIETKIEATAQEKEEVEMSTETQIKMAKPMDEHALASPAAKRLAREHEVDLAQVKGSGPEGRITEDDVQRFVEEATQLGPRVKEVIPLAGMKKTTAERVSRSFRTAPHSTVIMEVDMSNAAKMRKEKQISYTELLVKAVSTALKKHPLLNSTLIEGEKIKVYEDINVGVAVATEQGLVVPVIHNADNKSLEEIASRLRELAEKARTGKLSKEDVAGGTFTITNLGMYGVDMFMPIINPPEAAILAAGRIVDKPMAEGERIVIKPVMSLSLSYDHRIVDGAPAAQFLQEIKKILETLTF